jgi:ABC-type phosphate transport system auxiliary subunit
MADLLDKIKALMRASDDLEQIECTLTDGYAHALSLEAERWRLEKRMSEVAQGIQGGDTAELAAELSTLATRLDGNAADLVEVRALLTDLRRHADGVRVALKMAV